jgi:predicted RNA-binding protein with PIN domain
MLVDGWNVLLDAEGMGQREALVTAITGMLRGTGARARVFFDGQEEGRRADGQVDVVFTPAEVEADDAILDAIDATAVSVPLIVVSSDRRVAGGAAEREAEVVSSRTLLRALRLRRA